MTLFSFSSIGDYIYSIESRIRPTGSFNRVTKVTPKFEVNLDTLFTDSFHFVEKFNYVYFDCKPESTPDCSAIILNSCKMI